MTESTRTSAERMAAVAHHLFGDELPLRFRAPDGASFGPTTAKATLVFNNDDALRHIVRAPGELGFARAYVSGAIDIEGDLWSVVDLQRDLPDVSTNVTDLVSILRQAGLDAVRHKPPVPPEETTTPSRWRRHTRSSDASAISHHYDVSNDFYRLVLGPSWTYSCAVFESATDTLEAAQQNKYELISRKLGLRPGMRLLDVGCGWGGMVLHAAHHHGVDAVGITISEEQAALARERVKEAGLEAQVEIKLLDYRDLTGEPFDAISSIGMFEHVGQRQQRTYLDTLLTNLAPSGRLLNHQIGRRPARFAEGGRGNRLGRSLRPSPRPERTHVHRRGFVHRYVFPDGELHEVGDLVGTMQRSGFEVRHVETLREHYALTLRHWVNNLDANWDEAVALVGEGRARVWRLYMAASSSLFAHNDLQVHQVLAVKPTQGRSGFGFRPTWTGRLGHSPVIDLSDDARQPDRAPLR